MGERIPQSVAYLLIFKAYLSSDHVTEATGKTIAITISKNGGAFGNPNAGATNATEISSGWYKVTLDTTDTGTLGPLAVRGAVATIDDLGVALTVAVAPASQTSVDDLPTNAEIATALGTADDAVLSALSAIDGKIDTIDTNVDAILVDTAEIGAAGAGLTNINLPNQAMDIVGNITGNLSGSVGSVTGNVGGTINGLTAVALKDFFDTDSTTNFAGAVAGSVVAEIANNAGGGTPPTVEEIADEVETRTIAAVTVVNGLAANVITATAINADAFTAAKFAADVTTEFQAGLATASALATVSGFIDTEVAAILAAVDTEIAAIKAKTDLIPGTIDGKTYAQLVTLMAAVLLGKASGLDTTTAIYRAVDDSKDRVTATVTVDGNRSAVTLDAS